MNTPQTIEDGPVLLPHPGADGTAFMLALLERRGNSGPNPNLIQPPHLESNRWGECANDGMDVCRGRLSMAPYIDGYMVRTPAI